MELLLVAVAVGVLLYAAVAVVKPKRVRLQLDKAQWIMVWAWEDCYLLPTAPPWWELQNEKQAEKYVICAV